MTYSTYRTEKRLVILVALDETCLDSFFSLPNRMHCELLTAWIKPTVAIDVPYSLMYCHGHITNACDVQQNTKLTMFALHCHSSLNFSSFYMLKITIQSVQGN